MKSSPQNILVLHVAGLEKTTLALPALRSLRKQLPDSRITIVSSEAAIDLIRLAECADRILQFGRLKHLEILKPGALYRSSKLLNEMRQSRYDLTIDLQSNTESGIIASIAKSRSRLNKKGGLQGGVEAILERISDVIADRSGSVRHLAQKYLKRLEPLNVRPMESEPRLKTDKAADERVDRILRKHGIDMGELLVGIHPGAGSKSRKWPEERFASIASRMVHNFNAKVMIFSGPGERPLARRISRLVPSGSAILIKTPRLVDYVSGAARLSLLVANHSGPAHVAAAVGTPVVVASVSAGASDHDLLGQNVEHVRGPHIEMIPEDEVFDAACRLLKINRSKYLGDRN